jgi:hypothetical protein
LPTIKDGSYTGHLVLYSIVNGKRKTLGKEAMIAKMHGVDTPVDLK